ncbi:MAG: hypothetical protein KatS3mg057_2973 [Herpetosiphonaceae bacterium]|nr:MAG: hypothetical protein KatS3mg057_2973 [Herpetosiphonaceae bacterium]
MPGAVTAAIVPDEGHWVLIFAQDRASRPLSRFDIHAAGQLPLFSEVQTLGAMLDEDLPDSFNPNWALPLCTQQDTIGLLLIAGGAHLPEAKAIREPLIAIATMTATSLYNALLYTRVEQEASKNRAILESIADGVIVCDQSGAITLANDAAGAMLGCSAAELRGLPFATLPLKPVPFSGELFSDEHAQQLYIAQNRTLSLSIAPLATSDDRQAGQVIILHDVTKQYELDRAKTDFIATISHELRTPLTPIQGYLDLLFQPSIGGPLNENQLFFLQTIRQNVQVMSNLLNNVILLARIEMGNAKPEIQPVAVASAIEEALVSLRSQIEGKGLRLSVHVHDALPPLAADPHQLRIILVQIIDNACRYTEAGTITISAAHLAEFIQIDITDTGPGISYEDQQRLFTRFSRAGEQRGLVSTERGAGVGLAIVRRLVELQGGSIHVNSQPGKGSTFSILLRWMSSDYEPRHEPQSVDAAVAQE